MAQLDAMGQRYGVRPSAMAGIDSDPTLALQFDQAAYLAGLHMERRAREAAQAAARAQAERPREVRTFGHDPLLMGVVRAPGA